MDSKDIKMDISSLKPHQKQSFDLCMGLITRIALRMENKGYDMKEIADVIGCDDEEELYALVGMAAQTFDIDKLSEDFVRI